MDIENIAIKNPDITCCNCITEKESINHIHIPEMGYGSYFDGWSTQINLCDECISKTPHVWWILEVVGGDKNYKKYKYEEEIIKFVRTLPLAGQELFFNRYASGWNSNSMKPQDWIDYELGILPHEKCKDYGLYSPQEIRAYRERFPICDKVYKKIFSDGSFCYRCPEGAYGNIDIDCYPEDTHRNIDYDCCPECYMCDEFEVRKCAIKEINELDDFVKYERKRLNDMIKYAQKRLKLLDTDPEMLLDE